MSANAPTTGYVVLVLFKVDPAQAQAFEVTMLESAASVRSNPENRCYDINRDPTDPNSFMLYEVFDSEAAWDVHHARPELQALLQRIRPMQAAKPERSVWTLAGRN